MFRLLATIAACLLAATAPAQTASPTWDWARTSRNGDYYGLGATDRKGNTYVAGAYSGTTVGFDSTVVHAAPGNFGSTSYLVKYDPAGTVLWAKTLTGYGSFQIGALTTDDSGNCYVTGSFQVVMVLGTDTFVSAGYTDLIVAKYSPTGAKLWSTRVGGGKGEFGESITVDKAGNSYVAGAVNSDFTFAGTTFVNAGNHDLFFAKFGPSGTVVWARGVGGDQADQALDIALDPSGNLYMTGWFSSPTLNFGNGVSLQKAGSTDAFVLRLDTAGKVLWARSAGGGGTDQSFNLAVDRSSNCFITGAYNTSIRFGTTTFSSAGSEDLFIAKYDSTGAVRWARHFGGPATERIPTVVADASGYCYLTGSFSSPSIHFDAYTLQDSGSTYFSDAFIARFDTAGAVDWAQCLGTGRTTLVFGSGLDSAGHLYLTGGYKDTLALGATTLTSLPGGWETFAAKMLPGPLGSGTNSIQSAAPAAAYAVFPNPVSNGLHIRRSGTKTETLRIFDGVGRLLVRTELTAPETVVDMLQWPAGMYHVRIGGSWSASVVKP